LKRRRSDDEEQLHPVQEEIVPKRKRIEGRGRRGVLEVTKREISFGRRPTKRPPKLSSASDITSVA
jgi:hypothetical protein